MLYEGRSTAPASESGELLGGNAPGELEFQKHVEWWKRFRRRGG